MNRTLKERISIRDSIHGSIWVNPLEIELIDHPAFQRLRFIKQVGFIDMAFPGATHSRYAHSLGAMHMATRIFDTIFSDGQWLDPKSKSLFRQSLRLAALCHDIGHGPLSHSSESLMPTISKLFPLASETPLFSDRQATHEDYTRKLLTDSDFSKHLKSLFSSTQVTPNHIVELLFTEKNSSLYVINGMDFRPILQQIVSSEIDADRMDYLQRDSIYCGVNFGKFDVDWLIENLVPVEKNGAFFLGLKSRAIFSFEDFLLSRYHMFASVYLHHTPVILDKMLELHFLQTNDGFELPHDIETYILYDDMELWSQLRKSKSSWARRIVERRPYYLLDECKVGEGDNQTLSHDLLEKHLAQANIASIRCYSKSLLSKYFGKKLNSIFVVTNSGEIIPLESYTPLYERYRFAAQIHRIFVAPEDKLRATRILKDLMSTGTK